jgi:hypothetical protein
MVGMDFVQRSFLCVLALLISSWSGAVFSQYGLTGSWHGLMLGKPVELAVWSKPQDPGSTWTEFWMYFYSPEYDCFMPGRISYKEKSTVIKYSSYGTADRMGNCSKNVKTRHTFFSAEGRFDLERLPDELVINLHKLNFPGNPAGKKAKFQMTKGVVSKEMLALVTQYQHDMITKPDDQQLAILKQSKPDAVAISKININNKQESKTVVRSERFWGNFYDFDIPVAVFNGEFDKIDDQQYFRIYYIDMLHLYDEKCRASLPPNKVWRGYAMQNVYSDEFGSELYRDEPTVVEIYVDPRFVEKYDEHHKVSSRFYAAKLMSHVIKHGVTPVDKTMQWLPFAQMNRLIDYTGCNSATMYQMKENFLRAMYNEKSLQEAGETVKNASQESDSRNQNTLFQSCVADKRKRMAKSRRYIDDSEKYCECFDDLATLYMKPDERDRFADSFTKYWKEIAQLGSSQPKDHPAWRLAKIKNGCAR